MWDDVRMIVQNNFFPKKYHRPKIRTLLFPYFIYYPVLKEFIFIFTQWNQSNIMERWDIHQIFQIFKNTKQILNFGRSKCNHPIRPHNIFPWNNSAGYRSETNFSNLDIGNKVWLKKSGPFLFPFHNLSLFFKILEARSVLYIKTFGAKPV